MTLFNWISGQVLTFLGAISSRRRSRDRRCKTAVLESLEPRLVLSGLEITSLLNGRATTGASQPVFELDKPLTHTWELRNTGPESLTISEVIDDGGNGFQQTPFATSKFIPVEGRRDTVHDAKRGLLYITTVDGYVQRYDLFEERFLEPFYVGGSPLTLDLSPNENQLIVSNPSEPWFHLINLQTSTIVQRTIESTEVTISAAFMTDTQYVVSAENSIHGHGVPQPYYAWGPVLSISADRATVVYVDTSISSGGVGRFHKGDSSWTHNRTDWYNWDLAVSRDGQQVAVPTYFGTFIYDSSLQQIGLIGTYADQLPIGVVYSPISDTVYFAWSDFDQAHPSIDAWNTRTLQRTSVIDPSPQFSWIGNSGFVNGRLKISRDGQTLISTVTDGVRIYGTDDLTPRLRSGDANNNGLLDPGEVWKYRSRDVARRGLRQHTVRVTAMSSSGKITESQTANYRGVTRNVDYGDAPDPDYPTSAASNGASHTIVPGLSLGARVDQDLDAQPSLLANADDLAGTDDDDGVKFRGPLIPGTTATIDVRVTSSGPAFLNAWIDFNGDGDWSDMGEYIARDIVVTSGQQTMTITVPAWAIPGTTFSRFRLSTIKGLAVTGHAADGEVEDHMLSITPVVPVPFFSSLSVDPYATFNWDRVPYATAYEVQISTRGITPVNKVRLITTNRYWASESTMSIGRYEFSVRALNGDDAPSPWSPVQVFSVDARPWIDLPWTSTFDRTPELRWSKVPGAETHDILIRRENSAARLVRNVTGTSWSPPNDLAMGSYRFTIRAVNSSGQAASWSTPTDPRYVGGRPEFITRQGQLSVDTPFEWLPVAGAARYEILMTQTDGTKRIFRDEHILTTLYHPTFALPKGSHSVWVRAISESGEYSPWSSPLSISVAEAHPFISEDRTTLDTTPTWQWNPIRGVTNYEVLVQKLEGGKVTEEMVRSGIKEAEFTPTEPLMNGKYRVYFRSVRDGIAGSWQGPPSEVQIGGPPQQVTVDTTVSETPRFTWKPVEGATSYVIRVSKTGSSKGFLRLQGITATTFQPDSAWPKGEYKVSVSAMSDDGRQSAWSNPVFTTVEIERPFLSGVNSTFVRTPEFVWPAIDDAVSYDLRLERRESSGYEEVALYQGLTQPRFTPDEDLPDGDYRLTFRWSTEDSGLSPWQFPAAEFNVGGRTSIRSVNVDEDKRLQVLWRPVDGAAKSELWIIKAGETRPLIKTTIDSASEFRFDTPLSVGAYRIWIRSISATGAVAPWSKSVAFSIT